MGVPGFFSWLRRKYPQIVDECAKDQGQQEGGREERVCDNLYIDMNHIIHGCSHPRWRDSAYESEIEIFRGIQAYLERLVHTCRPQRLLMIAIDGVAPQAKMCQQRTRRFMSAHTERLRKGIEKEIRREMLAQARNAIIIPPLNSFDGNVITPGTPFMARLAAQLRRWLEYKVASDPDWLSMQVVLSDSNEPGEGEHKIMRFIRHQRACPEYDPNTSHVIYGQDADLILLALLTHEPHFSLLREAGSLEEAVKEMGLDPADWSTAKHQPLQFLNVSTLREYFRFEFKDLVGLSTDPPPAWEASMYDPWQQAEQDLPELAPENENSDNASEARAEGNDAAETAHSADLASSVKSGHSSAEPSIADSKEASSKGYGSARPTGGANSEGRFDFERVLQDFVLLTFLAGNDFLPSIPSLEIYGRPSGLDVLVRTYKDLLPALGGPITNGSIINPDRLKRILSKLAEDEEDAFQRLAMRKAHDFQWLAERETEGQGGCAPGYTGPDGSGQWVSMGELGDNDLDSVLGSLGGDGAVQSQVFDLLTATPEELTHELAQRVMKRLEDTLKGSAEADPVKLGNPGHRARLYEQRFGANPGEGVEKMCRKVSHAYAQGLTWVLAYYVHGSVPVPVSNTHAVAIEAAKNQMHGKSKQSSAADSNEGLGATWDWYYPYHYAPLISDLAKHATGGKRNKATIGNEVLSIEDDDWAPLNGPVRPLVQLMAVLPPESARACLPLKLALILEGTRAKGGLEQTSVAAALADMFPADLTSLIDMSGKMFAHTAIVKLPFANVKRLAAAAQQADPNEQELTPADEERNELRAGSIVTHNHHPCATALRLIARQGLSWDKARSKLTAQKRSRWSARPGKRSLSMLRLLVPSVHPEEESTPTPGQHMPVTIAGMDLAGVPTAPFSASLLAGCELPPAVVSERDWEREQRKFGPPFMAGRGGGRRGGSSFGGGGGGGGARGFNANGRGKYSARGAGQYSKAAVLTVPRQKAAPIPIRKPSEAPIPPPAWGQRASATRATQDRAVPDWGETHSLGASSNTKLDDEAIAQQLQLQYDREVNSTPGGISSLEEDSVTVARRLQEEEERRVRRNFQPTRRTAQQVKADEDFALRMQRQEREIAAHQVAYYQEMQRRQQSLDDMGGVLQQPTQAVQLPDAEFPELPTSNPTPSGEEAPKWPIQKVREKKRQAPQSGWDAAQTGWGTQPDSPSHIPAVHSNSTTGHMYDSHQGHSGKVHQANGWDESAANDGRGGVGSGRQMWGDSAEADQEEASGYEGWGDAESNSKYQPAAQNMGKTYTAANTAEGSGWGGGGVEEEDAGSGLGGAQATSGSGWGQAEPDQAYSGNAWGDREPNNAVNESGNEDNSNTAWGNDQTGGNHWEGGQAGIGTCKRRRYAAQKHPNMSRCRGLYRVANLILRASESSIAQRACASDATFARRGFYSSTTCSLHAWQAPIAAGSPIRELLKNVSASNAVLGHHIATQALQPSDTFGFRHNSASEEDVAEMVKVTGFDSMEELIDATVPKSIKRKELMDMGKYTEGFTESGFLSMFKQMASKNKVNKSYIGMGYYNTMMPPVIARNLLENPGWYTQYTPYQAEIAQGRLESLLNFQTMVCDLTGMPMSNSSLLDEATAAAEAMTMCTALSRQKKLKFLVSDRVHPQTIAVLKSRADGLGLTVEVGDESKFQVDKDVSGVLVQYPATDGSVHDYKDLVQKTHEAKAKMVVSTDLLACTMLVPPGEWGADIVIGSAQRFGVPMGYGGPHAAFLACANENKRLMPGRIIGVSRDVNGKEALRMAMQTREQHIRRDKATSNICTAQALLANISAMYAVYHGPKGLATIAERVNGLACILAEGARKLGHKVSSEPFFDTVRIDVGDAGKVMQAALKASVNLRQIDSSSVSIALDETTMVEDVDTLFSVLNGGSKPDFDALSLADQVEAGVGNFKRTTPFLEHEIFNLYHSEHEMLRYLKRLENKDLSLAHSMIALGSCTMKLNATSEMIPISWPELANLHPFVPLDQAAGYQEMFEDLAQQLAVITGFDSVSLQPNSGAAGEYAGLMAIRGFHKSNGEGSRNICIIPTSAHGTNPASAVMAGMKVVTTGVDSKGNIDMAQLKRKAEEHKDKLAALMVTYPSTHGVYEEGIDDICNIIHENGGQVYMDGANMNAQVGLTAPGIIGADVCHLNLHKTFCIPHGGGGPGMGPIGVKSHLAPFLPTHPVIPTGAYPNFKSDKQSCGTLASAPYGSALILPISYAYISMMGSKGLTQASMRAILNANYMAKRLEQSYPVLYKGKNGTCAHEFILDIRSLKESAGIEPEDIAKRLIDYGFHAPTMSWPVPGTLMVEPTESESKAELDRFCNAMIAIREEIKDIEEGRAEKGNNVVAGSPHPADEVLADKWDKPYSREVAAYPAAWCRQAKFWPTTSRVDNVYGDKHLVSRLPEAASAFAVAVGE